MAAQFAAVNAAKLEERIRGASEDEQRLRATLCAAEARIAALQTTFDSVSAERAQFEERASRVSSLEGQLEARTSGETILNARVAELTAELEALKQKALPDQETKEPLEGLLYFPIEGKVKPKDLSLIYKGPAGKLVMDFK